MKTNLLLLLSIVLFALNVNVKANTNAPTIMDAHDVTTTSFKFQFISLQGTMTYIDVSTNASFSSFVSGYRGKRVYNGLAFVTGLNPGQRYYYRARTKLGTTFSSYSPTKTTQTITATPITSNATNISTSGFTINWSTVSGANHYLLDVATNSSFTSYVSGYKNKVVTGSSRNISGLSGCTYYYRLRAVNSIGLISAYSNSKTVKMKPATPGIKSESNVTTNSFTAAWSSAKCATTYYLTVSENSSFSAIVSGYNNLAVSGTSKSVTGLNKCTYYYRVRAKNTSSSPYSSYSSTTSVKMKTSAPVAKNETSVTTSSFVANWNSTSCANRYFLQVSERSDFATQVPGYENMEVSGTSKQVSGLSGCTYYYKVRTRNSDSPYSLYSGAITVKMKPKSRQKLGARNITKTSFTADWLSTACATNYYLDVSTKADFSSFVNGLQNKSVVGSEYDVTGLNNGNCTYYYRVRAKNDNSPYSDYYETTQVGLVTNAPVALSANNITNSNYTARWQSVNCATEYKLEVSPTLGFSTKTTYTVTGTSKTLSKGSHCILYYRVAAINNNSGLSSYSQPVKVTLKPSRPFSYINTSETSSTHFIARWNASSCVQSYELLVARDPGFTDLAHTMKTTSSLSRTLSFQSDDCRYYFKVRAKYGNGNYSSYSQVREVNRKPTAPSAWGGISPDKDYFIAKWLPRNCATKYYLDVSEKSDFSTFVGIYHDYEVSGLQAYVFVRSFGSNACKYYYRVRAKNDDSPKSEYSSAYTVYITPEKPQAKPATNILSGKFKANWDGGQNCNTQYLLYVSTSSTFKGHVSGYYGKVVTQNSFSLTGLTKSKYYYRIKTRNGNENTDYSNIITVNLPSGPSPTGRNKNLSSNLDTEKLSINVYPNPASNILTVSSANLHFEDEVSVQMFDMTGKAYSLKNLKRENNTMVIDIANLPKGLYLMTIKNGTQIIKEKILKQ